MTRGDTRKEREYLVIEKALQLAATYRELAVELMQAADVLSGATDLNSNYPTVSVDSFVDAMTSGIILHRLLDDK